MSDTPTPRRRVSAREPRAAIGLLVVGSVAVALGFGSATPEASAPAADRARAVSPAVVVTGTDVRSAAWYCPLATTRDAIPADDAVVVANLSSQRAVVEISAVAGRSTTGRRREEIGGNSSVSVPVGSLGRRRDVGIVVESFGAPIAVEHVAGDGASFSVTPCATEANSTWWFPAGTTRLGTRERIALFNPFGQSAVLDIAVVTADGLFRPSSLQGVGVGARSRLVLDVNSAADLRPVVAVLARARGGTRVAAEVAIGPAEPAAGALFSVALGTPTPTETAHLLDIATTTVTRRAVVVVNPGDVDLDVQVQLLRSGTSDVVQRTLSVPASGLASFDPSTVLGAGSDATVIVTTRRGVFVVGDFAVASAPRRGRATPGAEIGTSAAVAARRWAFAADQIPGSTRAALVVENTGSVDASVEVRSGFAGQPFRSTVPAGQRSVIDLTLNSAAGAITLTSDQPVYVSRRIGTRRSVDARAVGVVVR